MNRIDLLQADPDLADALSPAERLAAGRPLVVVQVDLEPGRWRTRAPACDSDGLGVLLTRGVILRTTIVEGRTTGQLFGPRDVLRPWADGELTTPSAMQTRWTVLTPASVVPLDRRFVSLAGRWPSLLIELCKRKDLLANRAALQVSIARMPRIDDRLLMTFWRIAQRLGRVTPAGVLVPLPLTHETIASLVAASRPAVSTALGELARQGDLWRSEHGWLLSHAAMEQVSTPDVPRPRVRVA